MVIETKRELYYRGVRRVVEFCTINGMDRPGIKVIPSSRWDFDACAFYRPDTEANRKWLTDEGRLPYICGINICLEKCVAPCRDDQARNWNWPGNTTDRTPYGVLCHEMGHHVDWLCGQHKGRYYSELGEQLMRESGEAPISSYCPDPSEWFAEMFRVFLTNPPLLAAIRPVTYRLFVGRWSPCSSAPTKVSGASDWVSQLGEGVPERIIRSLRNKGAR